MAADLAGLPHRVKLQQFHSKISGPPAGRKWVFLHGVMGYLNNWQKIISGLDSTECCLAYDQRGHGRSVKPADGYAAEDYANDLRDILAELGWDQVILVGHSMGGRNALNFAARFPDKVERLVLEDISPEGRADQLQYFKDLLGVVPVPFPNRNLARVFFQHDFAKVAKTRDNAEMIGAFLNANLEEQPDGQMDWRFLPKAIFDSIEAGLKKDRWDELKSLKMPTLILHGEKSQELTKPTFEKMLAANPLAQGVTIPNSGHWIHAEQPQLFLAELRKFAGLE